MKRTLQIFGLMLILSIFASCDKDDNVRKGNPNPDGNYLIFGHFYGMCGGEECVEIFKLTEDALFEDTNDNYSLQDFSWTELADDKFIQVNDLSDSIPTEFLESDEDWYGCPDCADGGGIYIEYSMNGIYRKAKIDQIKENIPDYLHDFVDEVNSRISVIND